jgi:hypothetical protein
MTTDADAADNAARLARKAVRARGLTDPLGAKGFRRASERIEREARARRLAFVTALASFAGVFGLIVVTAPDEVASPPTAAVQSNRPTNVIAEIPIPSTDPAEPPTIVRIVAADVQPGVPDVRSSAS